MIGTAILCGLTLVAVGIAADVIITTRRIERSRPPLPSDDVTGDVPNLPEGFSFHNGVNTDARA